MDSESARISVRGKWWLWCIITRHHGAEQPFILRIICCVSLLLLCGDVLLSFVLGEVRRCGKSGAVDGKVMAPDSYQYWQWLRILRGKLLRILRSWASIIASVKISLLNRILWGRFRNPTLLLHDVCTALAPEWENRILAWPFITVAILLLTISML